MDLTISFFNLWFFVVMGYVIIWAYMPVVNKKRGKPIEDPELYNYANRRQMVCTWYISLFGQILTALFIPVQNGILFIIGSVLSIIGVALNFIAMSTFFDSPGKLNTKGIYQFSRNPMYVGGFLFILGLCIMGWNVSVPYGLFFVIFIYWIITTHRTVKKEEIFLTHKYGKEYENFKKNIPRYIGFKRL
ncbi:DUF1295 domain-containing protein [Maribellus comscasis]|uniref:DUF1295 domain-containing protein n=1 Tax=Maribellus comscasis TaxID=2681766 RepID=A0A6I6KBH9_9BACT|nr:isoprenylcysteine carboxylmethyltransferase family protein [Maribellus comscasis]QGY47584.1 DUF1295 domain-containing protein [Maribellus comscasis]